MSEKPKMSEPEIKKTMRKMTTQLTSLTTLVDAALAIEKLRVSSEVRQRHLARQGKKDPETDELHEHLKDLEDFVDGRVAHLIQIHPAYPWFSRVKGIGQENIGKVVAPIDIEKAHTISALWKFAGFSVEDGIAPKRRRGGGKLEYNSQLRSMCWRLGSCLLRAKGKFYDYYLKEKDKYYRRYENQGVKIVRATGLPKKDGKRYEPDNMIAEGHIHNMALRKAVKLFLACLWLVWREAEGLPVTKPYAIGVLTHQSFIEPWEMVDKPEKDIERAKIREKPSEKERAIKSEKPKSRERTLTFDMSEPNTLRKPEAARQRGN